MYKVNKIRCNNKVVTTRMFNRIVQLFIIVIVIKALNKRII